MRTSAGWQDVNVYRRNAAGTGWDLISLGLPNLVANGTGTKTDFLPEPQPQQRSVSLAAGVTVTGGFGPFSYSWVHTGGAGMSINNPAVAVPTFSATVDKNATVQSTWRVDVYDHMTGRTESFARTISLTYLTDR